MSAPARSSARLPAFSKLVAAVALLAALGACGGGGGGGGASSDGAGTASATSSPTSSTSTSTNNSNGTATGSTANTDAAQALGAASADAGGTTSQPAAVVAADNPSSRFEAARFLTAATFGPAENDINRVIKLGYARWIDEQFAIAPTSHRAWWEAADAAIKAVRGAAANAGAGQDEVWQSFWNQGVNGRDQLRQRVVFALSEIFVISAVDGNVGNQPRAMAAWLDMLGDKGLGTYRELLESVSLHPLMGLYLTHLKNQKADLATGRIPDQNYARESMQLLSIGLVKLNLDGTPALVNGQTVESYGPDDVAGLSRVFTGWSYACPAAPSSNCFFNGTAGGAGNASDPDRYFKPMVAYPQYHSTEAKTFLGVTIPAQGAPNPAASLKTALDTLAAHPNVGPFIGKQLIQRLVTSNPSPAYVRDVASVFNDNGSGVRGDLKAVVKAILVHPEARVQSNAAGKVREPVLRLSAYLRAFPHKSDTGSWKVGNTDSASTSLGQTPLRAGSVFNFFRPGYAAPGTQTAAAGLVAPEMQLLNETSAAGWVNYMRDNLGSGVGQFNGTVGTVVFNRRDLQRDWTEEMALAASAGKLFDSVAGKLLYSTPSGGLQTEVVTAVGKIVIPALNAGATNQAAIDTAKRNRVYATVLLLLASPEFLSQK